jgi:hypothetical protein
VLNPLVGYWGDLKRCPMRQPFVLLLAPTTCRRPALCWHTQGRVLLALGFTLTSSPPDLLTWTRELNPSLPFWLQAFPFCHGAPSLRPWYEALFVWMPCMKGHVMNHVVNTPTIYLLRFAQNSNVTTYNNLY